MCIFLAAFSNVDCNSEIILLFIAYICDVKPGNSNIEIRGNIVTWRWVVTWRLM